MGRKVMTNLDSILKSRDTTLLTKVHIVKAMVFPVVWTIVPQAPLSTGFSKQEYWSGLPFPSPEGLPNPGTKLWSPSLQVDFLPFELQESQDTVNYKLALAKSIARVNNKGICQLPLWRLNPVLLQLLTFTGPEGVQEWGSLCSRISGGTGL